MKKKYKIFWVIVVLLIPIIANSQKNLKSNIFNDNGKLKIDTSLSINEGQFTFWWIAESNILTHISKAIDYPEIARQIGQSGTIIVSFECDTFDLKNIRLLKPQNKLFDSVVLQGINNIKKKIVGELKHVPRFQIYKDYSYIGTYYIPISFYFIDLREEMKKTNTFPIIKPRSPGISRWVID